MNDHAIKSQELNSSEMRTQVEQKNPRITFFVYRSGLHIEILKSQGLRPDHKSQKENRQKEPQDRKLVLLPN